MAAHTHHVLFLCTGNSCRSQMAEGFANFLGGAHVEARSAGLEAHGKNPNAVAIMREAGVDISGQESKVVTPELVAWADTVVTVCGHADEHCPVIPSKARKLHWPISDPAKANGTADEIAKVFRTVREDIRSRVTELVATLQQEPTGT